MSEPGMDRAGGTNGEALYGEALMAFRYPSPDGVVRGPVRASGGHQPPEQRGPVVCVELCPFADHSSEVVTTNDLVAAFNKLGQRLRGVALEAGDKLAFYGERTSGGIALCCRVE